MIFFRALFAFNTLIIILSFTPAFFGTDEAPGIADKIFPNSGGGFRGDVLWLTLSGAALSLWSLFAIVRWTDKKDRVRSTDGVVALTWILEYVAYIRHLMANLWMG